jgi:UDP-glucuronate decarboxylase
MESADQLTGPINLGNPAELSIRQLAREIILQTGSKSKLVHLPLPEGDPRQRQPDIAKATELLGWLPTIALREGLAKTIHYFKTEAG